jgi:hypothetical protein
MQTVETTYQQPSAQIFLDDIYVPSLSGKSSNTTENIKMQKHLHDVDELHRFLESNCDCV